MCTAFCGLHTAQADAADNKKNERPNILWLTFEDTSAYEFGCYGNKDVHTPNADSLAARGIQFMNAWSVAPQSSAARSSLITGCYSSTYGMDVHPVPYDTPANIFFPQWLRGHRIVYGKERLVFTALRAVVRGFSRTFVPAAFVVRGGVVVCLAVVGAVISGTAHPTCLRTRPARSTFRLCRPPGSRAGCGHMAGVLP